MKNSTFLQLKFFSLILFFSCQTENSEVVDTTVLNNENEHLAFINQIDLKIENDMLVFASRDDYEKTLNYLGPLQSSDFIAWDEALNFTSLRNIKTEEELESMEIYDDLLATLLNPDQQISIDDHVFAIDVLNDRVEVLKSNQFVDSKSFSNKENKVLLYTTEDDVLDLLEGGSPSKSISNKGFCPSKKVSRNYSLGEMDVESKIVYQKGGIYKSLIAKIKQSGLFPRGYIELYTSPGAKNNWKNKKDSGKMTYSDGGYGRKYSHRPYYRTRRLVSYNFDMTTSAYHDAHPGTVGKLHIACN